MRADRHSTSIGVLQMAMLVLLGTLSMHEARAAGCPPGTVQVGERREETADAVIIHHICQQIAPGQAVTETNKPATESPCERSGPSKLPPGVVSPAMFVTQSDCRSAYGRIVRLQQLRGKLNRKIHEVEAWEQNISKYEKEFDDLRMEAQQDLAWEFIDHVPVAEGLDELKDKGLLENVNVKTIKLAYGISKGMLETGRGINAKEDREKAQIIIDGNREIRKALIEAVDPNDKALLEGIAKILTVGAKTEAITGYWGNMTKEEKVKFAVSVVEVFVPVAGVGHILENGGERYRQNQLANSALDSLHDAQSGNWNAHRYLTDKLNRVNDQIKEQQVFLDKYQMQYSQSQ